MLVKKTHVPYGLLGLIVVDHFFLDNIYARKKTRIVRSTIPVHFFLGEINYMLVQYTFLKRARKKYWCEGRARRASWKYVRVRPPQGRRSADEKIKYSGQIRSEKNRGGKEKNENGCAKHIPVWSRTFLFARPALIQSCASLVG